VFKEKKIKKNKETWILFSISSTMTKCIGKLERQQKQEQKDHTLECSISRLMNTNKI
jgi:hypothetical protein